MFTKLIDRDNEYGKNPDLTKEEQQNKLENQDFISRIMTQKGNDKDCHPPKVGKVEFQSSFLLLSDTSQTYLIMEWERMEKEVHIL